MAKLLALFVIVITYCGVCYGWGADGHRMIAQIASGMLTDEASNIVSQFIGDKTLADIAPLPDDYAHTPQGEWSAPCHYCNLPKNATEFEMDYCPGFCVVKSIQNYTTRLAKQQSNPTPCDFDTGVEPCPLEFLVHYVGDVHQPLHVGYGYDEGGNTVKITFFGTSGNLHQTWDDLMIWRWEGNNDWSWGADQLEALMQASNETNLIKEYLSITDPITWANESFQYVRTTVYNFTGSDLKRQQVPDLGEVYYARNLPIVFQRLIAAGVRLGALLNTILVG